MIKTLAFGAITALAFAATSASAATLNFLNTDSTNFTVNHNNNNIRLVVGDPTLAFPTGTVLEAITGDKKTASNGLELVGGAARLTYTFLGSEAGNENFSARMGTGFFLDTDSHSSQYSYIQKVAGLLDFSFGTSAPIENVGEFFNNGVPTPASVDFAIAYVAISPTSFYVLFDDISNSDRDFDDMAMRIDIAAVPLPAGGLLLLSALGGVAALRRRKKVA